MEKGKSWEKNLVMRNISKQWPRFILGVLVLLFGILFFTNADVVSGFFLYICVYIFGIFFFIPGVLLLLWGIYLIYTTFSSFRLFKKREPSSVKTKKGTKILNWSMVALFFFSIAVLISSGINNILNDSGNPNLYIGNMTQFYGDVNHMQTIAPLSDAGKNTFHVQNLSNLSNVGAGIIPLFFVALGNNFGMNVIGTRVIFGILLILALATLLRYPVIAIYHTVIQIKTERKALKAKAPKVNANQAMVFREIETKKVEKQESEEERPASNYHSVDEETDVREEEMTKPIYAPIVQKAKATSMRTPSNHVIDVKVESVDSEPVTEEPIQQEEIQEEEEAIDHTISEKEEVPAVEEEKPENEGEKEEPLAEQPVVSQQEETPVTPEIVEQEKGEEPSTPLEEEPEEPISPAKPVGKNVEAKESTPVSHISMEEPEEPIEPILEDEKEDEKSIQEPVQPIEVETGQEQTPQPEVQFNQADQQEAQEELDKALHEAEEKKKSNEVVFKPKPEVHPEEEKVNEPIQEVPTEVVSKGEEKKAESSPLAPASADTEVNYVKPPLKLLKTYDNSEAEKELNENAELEGIKIANFFRVSDIDAVVAGYTIGASTTRFHIRLNPGSSMNSISKNMESLSVALNGNRSVRFVPVIEGHDYSGIEVGNKISMTVPYRDAYLQLMKEDRNAKIPCLFPLGKDISGDILTMDLCKLPHMLVAGSTGSGKTVFVHSLIMSIIMRATPSQVKFILIDPKRVEFANYTDMPHLYCPIIIEPKQAIEALRLLTEEMTRRYDLLRGAKVTSYTDYLKWASGRKNAEKFPRIVCIIDEFADLMSTAKDAEVYVSRLAAMARACGIHLVVATQRPSTKVITGDIKNNIPARIALLVTSQIDSRVILDEVGAESLLGKGDLLARIPGKKSLIRAQSPYVTSEEIQSVVEYLKQRMHPVYNRKFMDLDAKDAADDTQGEEGRKNIIAKAKTYPIYEEVKNEVLNSGYTSPSYICRKFEIDFDEASLFLDAMEAEGLLAVTNSGKRVVK